MKIIGDYHTHTVYSHGKGSIEDNVKVAIRKGLKTLAISDHGPGHMFFGIKRSKFINMRNEIDVLNEKYPELEILLSIEANFMSIDGTIDVDENILKLADLVLCGYHFGSYPNRFFKDMQMHFCAWGSKFSKKMYEKSKKINTEMIINAMNKNEIFAITHPGAKGPIDIIAVAKVAAEKNVALEVNAKHGHLTIDEIKLALTTEVKFIVGSDAHVSERVGDFKASLDRCKEAAIPVDRIINAIE